MEVQVILNNRVYKYKNTGPFFTWVDEKNHPVPVLIHTKLREKALSDGIDISYFLSAPKPPRSEQIFPQEDVQNLSNNTEKTVSKRKNNLSGGFNPFNLGGQT